MTSETTILSSFSLNPPSYYTMFSQFTFYIFLLLLSSFFPLSLPPSPSTLQHYQAHQAGKINHKCYFHNKHTHPIPSGYQTHNLQTKPECYTAQLDQCNVHRQNTQVSHAGKTHIIPAVKYSSTCSTVHYHADHQDKHPTPWVNTILCGSLVTDLPRVLCFTVLHGWVLHG